jgi:hypothetical protein
MMKTEKIDRPTFQAIVRSVPPDQLIMIDSHGGIHPQSVAQVVDADGQLIAQALYARHQFTRYERVLR